MVQDPQIEAVRNRKTQKLFIIVDDSLEARYKVVNPAGEVLILPDLLFDEDPVTVTKDHYEAEFTAEQLEAFAKHLEKQRELARQQALRPPEPPRVTKAEPAPAPRPRRASTPKPPPGPVRRGLGASWSAPRLTFYRHKIDPLHPKQSFKVVVEGVGQFEITKEEFLANFNDAVMSPSYRAEGLYTYKEVPEKAKRWFK